MVSDYEVIHTKHLYPHKTIKQFTEDIDYLAKNCHPIRISDLLDHLKHRRTLPPKALLLTFDDGFREMHDIVAPILLQKGMSATFFLNSSFTDNRNFCFQHKASVLVENILQKTISAAVRKRIETLLLQHLIKTGSITDGILTITYRQRDLVDQIATFLEIDFAAYLLQNKPYLSSMQIKKMINDGFTIGAHSIDHPIYANLSEDEQIRQTTESVKFVKEYFNLDYSVFAFPHSDTGVTNKYFTEINKAGLVDISFGTAGMIEDCIPNNFQRLSLEKPIVPAQKIIALHFAKNIYRSLKHSNRIIRT
jgi:hypothetical protein